MLDNEGVAIAHNTNDTIVRGEDDIDRQIGALTHGDERDRFDALDFIRSHHDESWRARLGVRLRREISQAYRPMPKEGSDSSMPEPQTGAITRAWLFSALQLCDPKHMETLMLTEASMDEKKEPYDEVRFRILAGAYQADASNIEKLVQAGTHDSSPLVTVLARAITDPHDFKPWRSSFESPSIHEIFARRLPYLRAMRIVAIPRLAESVAELFGIEGLDLDEAVTIFHALRHKECAGRAAPMLEKKPGVVRTMTLMLRAASNGKAVPAKQFPELIRALDRNKTIDVLSQARDKNPGYRAIASDMLGLFEETPRETGKTSSAISPNPTDTVDAIPIAGYQSDTNDTQADRLGIGREVHVLTALMLSNDVVPPLAIGLFGNWGTGKSFFMRSMHKQVEQIATNAKKSGSTRFCANVVQIKFNAWHYADTSLWASLVTCIFEKLSAHLTPPESASKQHVMASTEVANKKQEVENARQGCEQVAAVLERDKIVMAELVAKREAGNIPLSAFSMDDVKKLLEQNSELKKTVEGALDSLAIPKTLNDVESLSTALNEAQSTFGRVTALIATLCRPRILSLFIPLVVAAALGIPLLAEWLGKQASFSQAMTYLGARIAQFGAISAVIATWIRQSLGVLNKGLEKVEKARAGIEQIVKVKKAEIKSEEEKALENRINKLETDLRERQDKINDAERHLKEAQETLNAITERASLKHFLSERLLTNDYNKHKGLVATVRDDFDRLSAMLGDRQSHDGADAVDRVVLYIDDLDRCAAPKVVEVLQAVHLLLAYPLFVVVVGVDARWLMHSLTTHYRQLGGDGKGVDAEWAARPQHYLEKIFQITYALKPMNEEGFGALIEELMGKQSVMMRPAPSVTYIQAKTSSQAERDTTQSNAAHFEPSINAPGGMLSDMPARTAESDVAMPDSGDVDLIVYRTEQSAQTQDTETDFLMAAEEEVMTVQRVEARFARRLHQFIPSPRAAKRLSNIYRILKAALPRRDIAQFEGTEDNPGHFRIPMLLLAILIHDGDAADVIFRSLHAAPGKIDITGLLRSIDLGKDPALERLLGLIIETCEREELLHHQELFRKWIPQVSRFSFGMALAA